MAFDRLVQIMMDLRNKCPWDKKQTIHSLKQMTLEETYELVDAVNTEDWKGIKEELGDLLLHIVFYARIADEQKQFDIDDVIQGICEKLIKRHPHIYADEMGEGLIANVQHEDDVKKNWEQLKLKEGKTSVLSGVPKALPAVVKAMRLQEKAKQVGFEWKGIDDVWTKVEEETHELQQAVQKGAPDEIEEEFGDLIFSLINYGRFLKIDAEQAINKTNKKFITRFRSIEEAAVKNGKNLLDMSLDEMDELWNNAKLSKK